MMSNVSIDKYLAASHEHTDSGLGADQDCAYSSERSNDSKSKYIPGMAAVFNRLPTGQMLHGGGGGLPQTHYNPGQLKGGSSSSGSLNGIMKTAVPKSILAKPQHQPEMSVSVLHQSSSMSSSQQHLHHHHHIHQFHQHPVHSSQSAQAGQKQNPYRFSNHHPTTTSQPPQPSIHVVVSGSSPTSLTGSGGGVSVGGKILSIPTTSSAQDIRNIINGGGGAGHSAAVNFVHSQMEPTQQQPQQQQQSSSIQQGVILSAPASPNRRRPLVVGNKTNVNNNGGLKDININNSVGGTLTRLGQSRGHYQEEWQQQQHWNGAKEETNWRSAATHNANQNLNPNDNNRSTASLTRRYNNHHQNNNYNSATHWEAQSLDNSTALVHRPPSRASSSSLKLILTPIIQSSQR